MHRIDPSSSFLSHPSRWKPILALPAVGFLAFVIWTVPNWSEFWSNVLQFPILWQISTNRRIIITLVIKVLSPLLLMGFTGIVVWMYSLVKPSEDDIVVENTHYQPGSHLVRTEKKITQNMSSSLFVQKSEASNRPSWDHSFTQFVPVVRHYSPETPLPTTPSVSEALKYQEEVSSDTATVSTEEEQASLPEQTKEDHPVESEIPVTPYLQPSVLAEPAFIVPEPLTIVDPLISIRLLKDVSMVINVPGGSRVVVPLKLNAKRVQLLAYLAWRRGELIDRDKILEHVFGWGLSDEEATEDKLSERFESHKKLLRRKVREVVIEQINKPAGRDVIDPDLDPFVSDSGFWGLSDICRVVDIEAIEADYKILSVARKDGKLVDEIPEYVKDACEHLIANYPGDFLETLMKKFPHEFRSLDEDHSWALEPSTRYRDYYLDALWHAANYEWQMSQRYDDDHDGEAEEGNQRKQQEHFGRAAQKYQSYALYACNSEFDAKVTFSAHGVVGERIGMSERALRRCVVLLGAIGQTDLVNQVWSAYYTQMKRISEGRWQPSKETQADVQAAKAQTNAYRFAILSGEFAERRNEAS